MSAIIFEGYLSEFFDEWILVLWYSCALLGDWFPSFLCDVRSLAQQCRIKWHKTGILNYITV